MAKKNVAVASQTGLAERPDWMGDSNRGSEEVTINDLTIPRLSIIQDLSPQRKKNAAEYIEGAEEGMLFNTVTNQLYTEPVLFVPVYFRMEWIVWKHRDHPLAGQVTEKDEPVLEIQDTAQHFGLLVDPNSPLDAIRTTEIVISMSRSQLKPSRQLNSQIRISGGDRWERYYRLSAVQVDGGRGEYYNWKVEQLGFVPEDVYKRAEHLYESVKSGERDVERGPASGDDVTEDDNM
jgi:hypothetical protein